MKPVDQSLLEEQIDKALDYISTNDFKTKIGKLTIEWPKSLIHRNLAVQKFWEAEDIRDVINNYALIDKTSIDVFRRSENVELFNKTMKDAIANSNLSENDIWEVAVLFKKIGDAYNDISRDLSFRNAVTNYNNVSLDNVYLGDLDISNNEIYTRCDLTIRDRLYNIIPGVIIYPNALLGDMGAELEKSLNLARSYTDYSIAFDINFHVLPKYRFDSEKPISGAVLETVYKGPKIVIQSITKTGGNRKAFDPVRAGTFMPQYS